MPTATPEISVAVSTYQRREFLPALIASLERQTLAPDRFEVVIADNGTTDGSSELLVELAATSPLDIRIVRNEENRGPAPGRNIAWRAARAPLVAFTDDDCEPTPGWLEEGLRAMGNGHVVGVGMTEPNPAHWSIHGPFSHVVFVKNAKIFETCNAFYRRADLDAVGGFDETFLTPSGEDTDLGMRVRKLGAKPRFLGDAVVHHRIDPSSFRGALRVAWRWTDVPLLVKRHPEVRRDFTWRVFWKPTHLAALLAAASGLLAVASPGKRRAALLLALPWLHYRLIEQPVTQHGLRRYSSLAGVFAVDATEVAALVRGSVRHRSVLL
jgi:GT2 family glycosyltransferase